jgi:arylsulfatase A-like enzyme
MDGFRWDYADKAATPNLDGIAREGVKARAMIPSFPTKTFPNHYTMATGLYPDHHGIVLNSFYDPSTDRYYRVSNREAVGDDVVIAAVGKPRFVRGGWINVGAVVIDAGYNEGIVGDVDFDGAIEPASLITPVPGGVGPMTIATLMDHTANAAAAQLGVEL